MKKLYILFLLLTPFFVIAQGPWDFSNSDDGWNQLTGFNSTTGATALTLTTVDGNDSSKNPTFGTTEAGVETSTTPIIAITLRNNEATGPDFLRVSYPKVESGRIYVNQVISTNDSNFVTYYFNLYNATNWTGTIDDIKLHFKSADNKDYLLPPSPNNISIDIDKIEFLESIPTTERQVYNFDIDNDSEGWSATNGTIVSVANGVLTFTPTANKYSKLSLQGGLFHVDLSSVNAMNVILRNLSTDDDELRLTIDGAIIDTKIISVSDSEDKSYQFDVSFLSGNTSDITLSFRNADQPDTPGWSSGTGNFLINSIIFDNTLSVDKVDFKDDTTIQVYPNPTQNILTINAPNTIEKIEVYNILGQKMLNNKNTNQMNVESLSKGMYISKIFMEGDVISTKRFFKN